MKNNINNVQMEKGSLVIEFEKEKFPVTRTDETRRFSQVHKGNALCKRKTIQEIVQEEKQRIVLPNIAANIEKKPSHTSNKEARLKKGYTFTRNSNVDNAMEGEIHNILLLTSLDTNTKAQKNGELKNESAAKSLDSKEEQSKNILTSTRTKVDGCHETYPSQHKVTKESRYLSKRSEKKTAKSYLKKSPRRQETGNSVCTQSFNSLCTELAMFKDAFYKRSGLQTSAAEETLGITPRSSSVQDTTFTLFRNHRRLSSQGSKLALLTRTSTRTSQTRVPNNTENRNEMSKESLHRKDSCTSESLHENCTCFKSPQVHFTLKEKYKETTKDDVNVSSEETKKKTEAVENHVHNIVHNRVNLPRIPLQTALVKTYFVDRRSAASNPEVSPREMTKIDGTSHEWPEDRKSKSSSAPQGKQNTIKYKCNEWLDGWQYEIME